MENLLEAMANYGFPMVVTAYLLIRLETKMDELTKTIQELIRFLEHEH